MTDKVVTKPVKIIQKNIKPVDIALTFLKHEFRKIFSDIEDADFISKMDNSLDGLIDRLGEEGFWFFVAAISEGFRFKYVFRRLTDTSYNWNLEMVNLKDITMTSMGGTFMNPILEKAKWEPERFAKIWKDHPEYSKNVPYGIGIKKEPRWDFYPILLCEQKGNLKVFDGMRRTCLAALDGKKQIQAYVGRKKRKGTLLVNEDKILFLRLLYDESDGKSEELLSAILTVMREYTKNYRNAKDVIKRRLWRWEKDEDLKRHIKKFIPE